MVVGDSKDFFVDFLRHNDLAELFFESLRDSLRDTVAFSSIDLSSASVELCWLRLEE